MAKPYPKLEISKVEENLLRFSETKRRTNIRDYFCPATSRLKTSDTDNSLPFSSSICQKNKKKRRLKFTSVETREYRSKSCRDNLMRPRLTQQTIANVDRDLVNCKVCGMLYTFWEEESHNNYHYKISTEFNPLIKCKKATIYEHEFEGKMLCIQAVNRNSEKLFQKLGEIALQYSSDNGLEMESIDSENLWGLIANPHDPGDPDRVLHYKLYVMFHQSQLVALLLAERIGYARQHFENMLYHNSESMRDKDEAQRKDKVGNSSNIRRKVFMSVERIWVRQNYQRKGLATLIIDKARENFLYPLKLPKHQTAISWPTGDGLRFFDKYFNGVFNLPGIDRRLLYLINVADSVSITKHDNPIDESVSH